jgi:hypothetical protein
MTIRRESYSEQRKRLLIELRLMRMTKPTRRVVKHQQRLMKALRIARKEGILK